MARLDPEQLVRIGNAAYGAGLALLMLGRREEAAEWLDRAALRWRESWEHATPTSWGRPIGVDQGGADRRRRRCGRVRGAGRSGSGRRRPSRRSAATRRRSRCSCSARWHEAAAVGARPCRAATTSRPRSPTRSPRSRGATTPRSRAARRGGARVVRDARGLPRGRRRSPTPCSCCRRSRARRGLDAPRSPLGAALRPERRRASPAAARIEVDVDRRLPGAEQARRRVLADLAAKTRARPPPPCRRR